LIILDTNVISAVMLETPDEVVVDWLDRQQPSLLWLTAITVLEIEFGIRLLARGRRRMRLERAFARALAEDFGGRVLDFDSDAARAAADIAADRRRAGRPVDFRDLEIGGLAASRGASLATRNVRHFKGMGVALIDPWSQTQ
jgi:predicted nucleic acid-binding protein